MGWIKDWTWTFASTLVLIILLAYLVTFLIDVL